MFTSLTWSCFILLRGMLTIKSASPRFSMSHQFEDCKKEGPANITHQRYISSPETELRMKLVITVPLFVALLCITAGMRNSVVKINLDAASLKFYPEPGLYRLVSFAFFVIFWNTQSSLQPREKWPSFQRVKLSWVLQVKIRVKNSLHMGFKLNL